ncbi:GNAT family N-acetyltransferase/peptidase C39 family protein [Motilimonas sp. 1_MG-2023]|uniref:GNAT family N-acetyltransferase/peptidase C39 family protein n=1 Tax=Motilimonas sp. 1_MG-2023 TaxID=3062672 RepID=UPI0026E3038F|nr:GNAT family N-acetyltransferase/peptidase C39 family protein [Motilimonas sp. 1_MG-2023]MDO6527561.1 GNAT family N-acetyltransferase/peptidase C39 family protein [Motilimonas sp. 1_MG-2023]
MLLRAATPNDLASLNQLELAAFPGDRISARQMKRFITSPLAYFLVVEIEQQIAGYGLVLFNRGTQLARLYSVAVASTFRGQNLAYKMVQQCEQEAIARGFITLRLEVRNDNIAAKNLYQKMGYKVLKTLVHYYDDLADGLRMHKRLDPPGPSSVLAMPLYVQTLPFTCGPSCLLMSFAYLDSSYQPNRLDEVKIWREATTVFMTSGHGGCSAQGLALAANRRGFGVELFSQSASIPFIDGVRDVNKKAVIELVHQDFSQQLTALNIATQTQSPTLEQLRLWIQSGYCVLMLISTYRFNGEKGPHWIVLSGMNEQYFFFHDPNVEQQRDIINSAYVPISQSELTNMVKYGKQKQISYVVIKPKH